MFRDELDVLECRLEEISDSVYKHVLVEAPVTHRGVGKPLYYQENKHLFSKWNHKIISVTAEIPDLAPWEREHHQRHQAWQAIENDLQDDDLVLLCDVDEIPSEQALAWSGNIAAVTMMKVCIYAIDWQMLQPDPTAVIVRGKYLRSNIRKGKTLGQIRDERSTYQPIEDGGWHFSWLGGPKAMTEKLDTATCHTEIYSTPQEELIRSGYRYRAADGDSGGGVPLKAVEIDDTYPAFVREHRCPASWFRPREESK